MQNDIFKYYKNAHWAISREIRGGDTVYLIQERPVFKEEDPKRVLTALGIDPTNGNLDHFFPKNDRGNRCPTFKLMELWYHYQNAEDPNYSPGV